MAYMTSVLLTIAISSGTSAGKLEESSSGAFIKLHSPKYILHHHASRCTECAYRL